MFQLFEILRETNPNIFQKLIIIKGDIAKPQLGKYILVYCKCYLPITIYTGISDIDRKTLIENVDIIYHAAASIRFDDSLQKAIFVNVRSTRDILNIAAESQRLKCFVHVSTAYCNADKKVVEEKLYPPHGDWKEAIILAEEADEHMLSIFADKYIHPLPNTYAYAKSLAEHVVSDMCYGKIPAVIVRPTVGK